MDAMLSSGSPLITDSESFTRRLARWGSVAAAMLFALAFATERDHNVFESPDLFAYTACVVAVFVGYALAWSPRGELVGSLLAIVATVAAYCVVTPPGYTPISPAFLLVALPAALHFAAVVIHGRRLPRSEG